MDGWEDVYIPLATYLLQLSLLYFTEFEFLFSLAISHTAADNNTYALAASSYDP